MLIFKNDLPICQMRQLTVANLLVICREEPIVPDEHEEVNMNDFDPHEDRRQRTMSEDDEDQMHGHGPGVSCATQ